METPIIIIITAAVIIGVILPLFIIRTGKRPEDCTCKTYNWFTCGPVNECPAHKHMG